MQKATHQHRRRVCLSLAIVGLISGLGLPAHSSRQYLLSGSTIRRDGQAEAWRPINTNLPSLDVRALAIDPSNPAAIYAGDGGQVMRSTDGGASWVQPGSWLGEAVVTLAIDSANPNILYAGTAGIHGCYHSDRRLFKSTDAGVTWTDTGPNINGCDKINALVLSPADPRTIYVANFDDFGDSWTPLIKTLNGGESWIPLFNPPFAVLAIDPGNTETLYGGTFDFLYFGYEGYDNRNGVLKSTDGGVSWGTTGLKNTAISALATDPVNPGVLYAGSKGLYSDPRGFRGLFKSHDGGATWYEINKGLGNLVGTSSSISALVVHPRNPNILYAGTTGSGVFKSIDGGANWIAFNEGLTNLNIRTLAIAKSSPSTLCAATAGGVFKIVDLDQPQWGTLANVSAASYALTGLASEAIATSFGTGLARASIGANVVPLPTELAGTTVKVKDSSGTERLAPLFFVSAKQVNYQIPPGTAAGVASITITNGDGSVSIGTALIKAVAPGMFAANQNGQGVAAAVALRVRADGSQSYEETAQFDAVQGRFVVRPIDLGPESDQVFLIVFGTGIRFRSSLSAVTVTIGGTNAEAGFAGAQPDFIGVDQVNVRLPRSLAGRGEVDLSLAVDAQMANPVRVSIR